MFAELAECAFNVEGNSGQSLGQGVVDLAGEVSAFLGAGQLGAFIGEPGPLNGDTDLIRNRRQQVEFIIGQPAPGGTGDVEDAQRLVLEVERNARVIREPLGEIGGLPQDSGSEPAAFQHVDVLWRQFPVVESLQTPAGTTCHPHGGLQVRREIACGRIVEVAGVRILQPDPAGAEAE